ncbi:hypothetical protein SteCoe_7331 [Stentor coeruleus]|uniref:Uncharacterized protein n=1 Tax=Stentor coeruleus TaxID=5963 RepID=A0A1R2CMS2_9CILI|nr:hypothetical protein SteCoe_7331 [Stentor coeruleus]
MQSRSISPRPNYQSDQRFQKNFDSSNRSPRPYDNYSQSNFNRRYENPHNTNGYQSGYQNGYQSGNQNMNPRFNRNDSSSRFGKNNYYKSNGLQKKIRTDFPDCVLCEYGFLDSPQRGPRPNNFYRLMNPSLGKNDIDEVLATVAANK